MNMSDVSLLKLNITHNYVSERQGFLKSSKLLLLKLLSLIHFKRAAVGPAISFYVTIPRRSQQRGPSTDDIFVGDTFSRPSGVKCTTNSAGLHKN